MQQMDAHQLVEASPLFRQMQADETAAMLACLHPVVFQHGTRILERGVWHGRLYLIAAGEVSVLLSEEETTPVAIRHGGSDQSDYIVARLGPGQCFGEMSLITGEVPSATVRAEQDVTLWSLKHSDFLNLLGTCPTLLRNINTLLSYRLARTNQQLLAQRMAELTLIVQVQGAASALDTSLAPHIAAALAMRTYGRVLLLELCSAEDASAVQFVPQAMLLRPDLLACSQERVGLQEHHAALVSQDGALLAACCALTTTREQLAALDMNTLSTLTDLALAYDHLLLIATPRTPPSLLAALSERHMAGTAFPVKRVLALVAASLASQFVPTMLFDAWLRQHCACSLFVTEVAEPPTMAVQERYAGLFAFPVTRLLPTASSLLVTCYEHRLPLCRFALTSALAQGVDFVARHIAHQTVGIAFGGGGARGFAHLGVLAGLQAHQIPLDYIAACSSGIIAPGMHLIGKSLEESEEIFLEIQRHIVQWRIPRTSLFSNRGLKHMLRSLCGDLCFEDLETPFAMVAVDLATRAGVVLDRGPLWLAGLASVALPGFFPPVLVGEHILMDAGMHDPVPVRLVRKMGADILLASELGGQEPPTLERGAPWLEAAHGEQSNGKAPHIIDLLLRTYDLAMATIGMHSIREADVVFRPKLYRVSLRQFSEGRKFVAAGREAVEQALPDLKAHLPWVE